MSATTVELVRHGGVSAASATVLVALVAIVALALAVRTFVRWRARRSS